jgi:hypothetical protein
MSAFAIKRQIDFPDSQEFRFHAQQSATSVYLIQSKLAAQGR